MRYFFLSSRYCFGEIFPYGGLNNVFVKKQEHFSMSATYPAFSERHPFKWVYEWFAQTCPSLINLAKRIGFSFIFFPRQKKVALILYFSNIERTNSVTPGVGPSSNVRKTFLAQPCNAGRLQIASRKISRGKNGGVTIIFNNWNRLYEPEIAVVIPASVKMRRKHFHNAFSDLTAIFPIPFSRWCPFRFLHTT